MPDQLQGFAHLGFDLRTREQQGGSAVFQHVGHLGRRQSPADRSHDGADLGGAEQDLVEVVAILANVGDPLFLRDALLEKFVRYPG
jgi:hypothetical protein